MEEKELLKKLLKIQHNFTGDEFASLYEDDKLKDDAFDILKNKDADRITKLKDNKDATTEAYNKGAQETRAKERGKFEKEIKDAFEFESDSIGVDLIKELVGKKTEKQIKDTDVKTHPLFLDLEKKSIPKTKFEELQTEFDVFKQTKEREKVTNVLRTKGREVFMGLNPVLNKDKTKAENQINTFLNLVTNQDVLLQDDGNHILLDKEKKRKEDEHGNPIKFTSFVEKEASKLFDFEKQDKKGASGNDNDGGDGVIIKPANDAEYQKAITNASSPEERAKIYKAYHG